MHDNKTLIECHERRMAEHETGLTVQAEKQYAYAIRCFGKYLGHEPTLDDLTPQTFNAYIDALRERGLSPSTVKLKFRHVKTIWRFASEEQWVDPPRKLRKVRIPHADPVAWRHEDVCKLVETALRLTEWPAYPKRFYADLVGVRNAPNIVEAMRSRGWGSGYSGRKLTEVAYRNMLSRLDAGKAEVCRDDFPITKCVFFSSFISAGWDTGLRVGDIFRIRKDAIRRSADGSARLRVTQSKTGYPLNCFLNAETVQLIDRCLSEGDRSRELIWPPRKQRHWFYWHFRVLVSEAGLPFGTSKYIRRGAGSMAESLKFGAGTSLLGHRSRDVTVRHYLDPEIVQVVPMRLPSVSR